MYVFVTPLEVVDYAFVCQLFLHDEEVLEKLYYSFIDVKVIELCDHCFLILQILFILVDQGIALIDNTSDVIENLCVSLFLKV